MYVASGTPNLPKLNRVKIIGTGGVGLGGGYFGIVRLVIAPNGNDECVFAADGGSSDIAAISGVRQKLIAKYQGSKSDSGGIAGIGLALHPSGKYLYGAFSGSQTIATFAIGPGCTLDFTSDVIAPGLNGGFPHGMAARGNMLVVAYGDGSIGSFNISSGTPIANNDAQLSTGYLRNTVFPDGVDVTRDGRFAIFGDASGGFSEVEVSDISSGKLTTTVNYGGPDQTMGSGLAANNVVLSPDETLLYISDNLSGQVTAAYFDKTDGTLTLGCISKALTGLGTNWTFSSALATAGTSGTGSVIWVAEDGLGVSQSSIGMVEVTSRGGQCSLTETANSPAADPGSLNLCWLNAFPQRPF
jgi:sugar lactone lactonase YvrE